MNTDTKTYYSSVQKSYADFKTQFLHYFKNSVVNRKNSYEEHPFGTLRLGLREKGFD